MVELIKVGEWQGEDIEFDPSWGTFQVPFLENGYPYNTYANAKAALDKHFTAQEKAGRRKLSLACLDQENCPVVVTGIHASTGNLLTTPKTNRYNSNVYPDVQWLKDARKQGQEHRKKAQRIDNILSYFSLSTHRAGTVDQVENDYKRLVKGANATTLEKELAKPIKDDET